jgi:hypothetical protein
MSRVSRRPATLSRTVRERAAVCWCFILKGRSLLLLFD